MARAIEELPATPVRRARVLVVDDDETNVKLVARYLEHEGYDAFTVTDGASALDRLEQGDIDLVVLDVRMPEMDGLEVCRRIRAQRRFTRLPVIFLTADEPNEVKEAASLEAGGDEYLLKPISRRVLTLRVKNLLRLANVERERELLAQVANSEKLAAIGQVAAGVAHEINNPLSFILSNLSTLSSYLDDVKKVVEAYRVSAEEGKKAEAALRFSAVLNDVGPLLDETRHGGERVRRIVQELKTFSRMEDETLDEVDLADVMRNTLVLIERELQASASVVKDFQSARIERGMRSRLQQVALNLVINALHAIEVRPQKGVRHTLTLRTWTDGAEACLEVSDTGVGIPEKVRARIFEPFFTTKPVGVGSGLGLAVSSLIAQRLGGRIDVTSVEGQGSTFTLRLPVRPPAVEEAAVPAAIVARA